MQNWKNIYFGINDQPQLNLFILVEEVFYKIRPFLSLSVFHHIFFLNEGFIQDSLTGVKAPPKKCCFPQGKKWSANGKWIELT